MYFISLLLIIAILRYKRHWLSYFQNDKAIFYLLNRSAQQALWQFVLAVIIPSLSLSYIFFLLSNARYGLLDLLLASIVFAYSLGRGNYISVFKRYKQAWQQQDKQAIQSIINCLDPQLEAKQDLCELHQQAKQVFAYQAFTRLFVVLFWFALLGPVAALFYRLNQLALSQHNNAYSRRFIIWMEWPAARLFAFSAALLGNFNAAYDYCKDCLGSNENSAPSIVSTSSQLALGFSHDWLASRFTVEHSEEEIKDFAIAEISALEQLIRRSVNIAVVGVAIFHIIV